MEQPENQAQIHIHLCALVLFCLGLFLSACNAVIPPPQPSVTSLPSATASLTPNPTSTSTPTAQPPVAVLLAGTGSDQSWVSVLQAGLNDIVTYAGLRWQVRQQLTATDLVPEIRLVVALPPNPGLAELVALAPGTQFLALGINGLATAPNLTTIDTDNSHFDQQGFIAGYIAAMLSEDWRVGAISISDTVDGRAARTGFLNGTVYFCGLCRPAHPPFYEYPLYIELPASATTVEWQEAANYMLDHYVQTVYIYPGVVDETMLSILAGAKVNIISSGEPPEAIRSSWVVSLTRDALPFIQGQAAGLLDGSLVGGQALSLPIQFTQSNPSLFSPGKQRLAQQVLSDLQAGFIDTGVDLSTGENKP